MNDPVLPLIYAVDAITVNAHYEPHFGWVATCNVRRSDQTWKEASQERYSGLDEHELLDVLVASLAFALEPPRRR